MSKEELDSLFKNKLQDHERQPSDDAWSRLEEQLPGKKKGFVFHWWQAAAAILLLSVAGYILLKPATDEQLADNSPAKEEIRPTAGDQEVGPQVADTEVQENNVSDSEVPGQAEQADNNKNNLAESVPANDPGKTKTRELEKEPGQRDTESGQGVILPPRAETIAVITPALPDQRVAVTDPVEISTVAVASEANQATENSTLRISIEEFDEALLANQTTEDSVADNEKKNGLKKLWAAVKNAPVSLENGLGELREAKNDLLSLNKEETE